MPSRRHVLAASVAGLSTLAGCASGGGGQYGNIQLANQTDDELRVEIRCRGDKGFLSEPTTVYEETFRLLPTDHSRTALTDVAPPGGYDVQFSFEGPSIDGERGPFEERWEPDGDPGEALLITVTPDLSVEFRTQS